MFSKRKIINYLSVVLFLNGVKTREELSYVHWSITCTIKFKWDLQMSSLIIVKVPEIFLWSM